jgi:hypothetical protein
MIIILKNYREYKYRQVSDKTKEKKKEWRDNNKELVNKSQELYYAKKIEELGLEK